MKELVGIFSSEKEEVKEHPVVVEKTITLEQGHVYVHCYFNNEGQNMLIRIWKSTFLIDLASGSRSGLIHVENITYAPEWTRIPDHSHYHFLLIFSALPNTCVQFDLLEDIPQPGGFYVGHIPRNKMDVYHVNL